MTKLDDDEVKKKVISLDCPFKSSCCSPGDPVRVRRGQPGPDDDGGEREAGGLLPHPGPGEGQPSPQGGGEPW